MEDVNSGLYLYDELVKRGFTIETFVLIAMCVSIGVFAFGLSLEVLIREGYLDVRNS